MRNGRVTERLLPAVLLLKAVALALRDVPELNGLFEGGVFRAGPQRSTSARRSRCAAAG